MKFKILNLPLFKKEPTVSESRSRGYFIDIHFGGMFAYDKKFMVGDEVFYFGHDGVGGWSVGDSVIVDKELYSKKNNLHFYKKQFKVRF